ERAEPAAMSDILALMHEHVIDPPLFLPLAARCFGLMARGVPPEAALAFRQRMGERMVSAGAGLERHFNGLRPGQGGALLRDSSALIIGRWQMSAQWMGDRFEFAHAGELDRALTALWDGTGAFSPMR